MASISQELNQLPLKKAQQRTIEHLTAHYAEDNLDPDEFERRLEAVYNTKKIEELQPLIQDLPDTSLPVPSHSSNQSSSIAMNTGKVKKQDTIVNILSGTNRKGIWKPARTIQCVTILGGAELDFRSALIPPEGIEMNVVSILGGVNIIVPPGVNVQTECIPILGGVENRTQSDNPSGPTIAIKGTLILGGIEIREKEPKQTL